MLQSPWHRFLLFIHGELFSRWTLSDVPSVLAVLLEHCMHVYFIILTLLAASTAVKAVPNAFVGSYRNEALVGYIHRFILYLRSKISSVNVEKTKMD